MLLYLITCVYALLLYIPSLLLIIFLAMLLLAMLLHGLYSSTHVLALYFCAQQPIFTVLKVWYSFLRWRWYAHVCWLPREAVDCIGGCSYVHPFCERSLGVALFKMPCKVCWRNCNCTGLANDYLKLCVMRKEPQECIYCVLGQCARTDAL